MTTIPIESGYVWSYSVVLALVVFIPGLALSFLMGVRSMGETVALGAVLGLATSTVIYLLLSMASLAVIFPIWPISMSVLLTWMVARKNAVKRSWLTIGTGKAGLTLMTLFILLLLVVRGFYNDGLYDQASGFRFTFVTESLFHTTIIYALETNIASPTTPWIAGVPLNYHVFMDLFGVVIHELSGVPIFPDLIKLNQTFFLILLVLSSYVSARHVFDSRGVGLLNTLMTLFGGCATAIVPGVFALGFGQQWDLAFGSPTMPGLYWINPQVLALSVFYMSVFCMSKYLAEKRPVYLLVTSLLFAIMVECKVTMAIVALGALATATMFTSIRRRDFSMLRVALGVSALSAPLLFVHWVNNAHGAEQQISLNVAHYLFASLNWWAPPSISRWAYEVFSSTTAVSLVIAALLLLGFAIAAMGFRALALASIFRREGAIVGGPGLRSYLAVFIVLGLMLFLFTRVTPRDYPYAYDNSSWFGVAAISAATLLAAREAFRMLTGRHMGKRCVALLLLTLSFTVSMQSVYLYGPLSGALGPELSDALTYLRANSSPTDVVMVNSTFVWSSMLLTTYITSIAGRPVVLGLGAAAQFAGQAEIEKRIQDIQIFYKNPRNASQILRKYNVSFVWVEKGSKPEIDIALQNFGQSFVVFYKTKHFAILRVVDQRAQTPDSMRIALISAGAFGYPTVARIRTDFSVNGTVKDSEYRAI